MNILGIETSCDETAASVVRDGKIIRSHIVSSSIKDHQKYGGVIPEIASRRQMEWIDGVVRQALETARLKLADIDAVAVTKSPGLIGSLLVGLSFGRALAFAIQKPLVEVDHIKAHLYANFLAFENDSAPKLPKLPAIGLVVSGGHTSLYQITDFDRYRLLGETKDDAVGEAYDKVARIMQLGYPGGPVIDRLAQKGQNEEIKFNCSAFPDSFDFSFSGIKTAVLYHVRKYPELDMQHKEKISFAFQESVIAALIDKCVKVLKKKKMQTLLIGGGVAANSSLRLKLQETARKQGFEVFFPPLSLCMDNASMIAGLGFQLLKNSPKISKPPK